MLHHWKQTGFCGLVGPSLSLVSPVMWFLSFTVGQEVDPTPVGVRETFSSDGSVIRSPDTVIPSQINSDMEDLSETERRCRQNQQSYDQRLRV